MPDRMVRKRAGSVHRAGPWRLRLLASNPRGSTRMKHLSSLILAAWLVTAGPDARAADASAPRGATLSIYDSGFARVSELRTLNLAGTDDRVVFKALPAKLDPQTLSVEPAAGGKGFEVQEQRFEDDLTDPARMLQRYRQRPVQVRVEDGVRQGKLAGFAEDGLQLIQADGSLLTFPNLNAVGEVMFPEAERNAYLEPTLIWSIREAAEGQQNVRLNYLTGGLSWRGAYDILLNDDGTTARLQARVAVRNQSGGGFRDARVRLVLTEQGSPAEIEDRGPARPYDPTAQAPQRFAYGAREPQAEQAVASLAAVETYEVPRPLTLADGDVVHVQLAATERLPVTRFYVYDGVRFDRFQRNRRNDWNYGTEYRSAVDTHLEFDNSTPNGLGFNLPPGQASLYQRGAEETVDLLGRDTLLAVPAGGKGHLRMGPARGLRGERERTGYSEVKPLREYEESFEIRLANDSDQTVVIRVVEHLYRWSDYEIVKSDLDYQTTGAQTIEFRPELKPGGRRSIHYTVRYRW